jgi:hypothetical protein
MKAFVYRIGQLGGAIVSLPALRGVWHYSGQPALLSGLADELIPEIGWRS